VFCMGPGHIDHEKGQVNFAPFSPGKQFYVASKPQRQKMA